MWFDTLRHVAEQRKLSPALLHHLEENRERILSTIDLLERQGLRGKRICEIGPGGVGVACREYLQADVDGFDYSEWSRPMCEAFGIPWRFVDLHRSGVDLGGPYDAILMCEVIEHVARWPAEVLGEVRSALKPGGLLLVTTQNLHRLSQRVRMLMGQRLFAHYVPEELVMAHIREYTVDELVYLFRRAGFQSPETRLVALSDLTRPRPVQALHSFACRLAPGLSSFIYCWARR